MRILVTGATGFVGGRLAQRLLDDDIDVRALVRRPTDRARVPEGVEVAVATLEPTDALRAAVSGVDCVIHAAGGGRSRTPDDFYRNNTATTQTLLDTCLADGAVRRFLLVSSVAARARLTHYGRAKRQAEDAVLAAEGIDTVVVRPPAVYGPGDDRMLPLFKGAARGVIPRTSKASTRMSFIHIDDCASALACAAHAGAGVYEADDGPARTWAELADVLGQALNRTSAPRVIGLPRPVLMGAAMASEAWSRLADRAVVFTRDKVRELTETEPASDSSRMRDELGWSHAVELVDGARQTIQWYRDQGSL